MTAMTCSRVTPAFTVRTTITPVVVGDKAWAWATDELVMEVAPIRVEVLVKVTAKTTLRSAFIILLSAIMAGSFVPGNHGRILGLDIGATRICKSDVDSFSRATIRDNVD